MNNNKSHIENIKHHNNLRIYVFFQFKEHGNVPILLKNYALDWQVIEDWKSIPNIKKMACEESEKWPHRVYKTFQADKDGRLHLTDGQSLCKKQKIADFLENYQRLEM